MNLDFFELVIIILLLAKIGDFINYEWYVLAVLYIIGVVCNSVRVWYMDRRVHKSTRMF